MNMSMGGLDKKKMTPLDKSKAAQWTFTQVVSESLNPSVSLMEEEDYARYVEYPQQLGLVLDDGMGYADEDVEGEYEDWIGGEGGGGGLGKWDAGAGGGSGSGTGQWGGGMWEAGRTDDEHEEIEEYRRFLRVAENPLTVVEEDGQKKRYKAYRKWLAGKSLFKQQPID